MKRRRPKDSCLWAHSKAEGECKYVIMASGEVLLVDPMTCAAHQDAVAERGLARGDVLSAGRVLIDRKARTVSMGERDSHTLRVKSRPGDQDARAVESAVFSAVKRRRRPA